nr:protein kinase [Planctomycetota bacterium]
MADELLGRTLADAQIGVPSTAVGSTTDGESVRIGDPPEFIATSLGERLALHGWKVPDESRGARYVVERPLGAGAGGCVWAATDRTLDRPVAVKALGPGADEGDVASFVTEARITASLQHPNVLPVYDLEVSVTGVPCFTMKRIEGMSLGEAVRRSERGDPPESVASVNGVVSIFIGVCQALSYAHGRSVIHQDVKPDNIMLGAFGEVLLVDWGCAASGEAHGGRLYGTPLYMSPEQARRSHADARSDIYCLGASLFHALMLRAPTTAPTTDAFWERKRRGEIDPPTAAERARVPPELLAVALKAMAADPADRYQTVAEVLAELRQYQAGLAVSAYREGLWRLLVRWYAHHRAATWIAVAALALVALAGAALWREKLLEQSRWLLVHDETFNAAPDELEARWAGMVRPAVMPPEEFSPVPLASRRFSIAGGRLDFQASGEVVDIAWRERLFGNLRVDWDYTPIDSNLNLNCFIGADRDQGYTFHVGGWGDPAYIALTKGRIPRILDHRYLARPLEQGRAYAFRMEREEGRIRLSIGGEQLFDFDDADQAAFAPQSFGFDAWDGSRNGVARVRVYRRPPALRISPLQLGDQTFQNGDFTAAERLFRDLVAAYPGNDIAVRAEFKAALSALRAGAARRGLVDLARFCAEHPRHELTPAAYHERLRHSPEVEWGPLYEALAAYRGDPRLRRVLYEIGERDQVSDLQVPEDVTFAQARHPPDLVQRIERVLATVHRWSDRYGIADWRNAYLNDAAFVLRTLGRSDLLVSAYLPTDVHVVEGLLDLGRYEEALARFSHVQWVRVEARLRLGRIDEIIRFPDPRDREVGYFHLGDLEQLLALRPHGGYAAAMLIEQGRAAEVAADDRYVPYWRSYALLTLQRAEAALAACPPGDKLRRSQALIALGRYDEALVVYPVLATAGQIAIAHAAAGRRDEALALAVRLRNGDGSFTGVETLFAKFLLPALIEGVYAGASVDAGTFADGLKQTRNNDGQRFWHTVAFVAGTIDEATFLRQPQRLCMDGALHVARAYAAEVQGDGAAAFAAYSAWRALPPAQRRSDDLSAAWVDWRLRALAPPP